MLASQLCMFDDKTDSKTKWVKKHSMVVLPEISSLFMKISICDMAVVQFADLFNDYDVCKVNVSCLNLRN